MDLGDVVGLIVLISIVSGVLKKGKKAKQNASAAETENQRIPAMENPASYPSDAAWPQASAPQMPAAPAAASAKLDPQVVAARKQELRQKLKGYEQQRKMQQPSAQRPSPTIEHRMQPISGSLDFMSTEGEDPHTEDYHTTSSSVRSGKAGGDSYTEQSRAPRMREPLFKGKDELMRAVVLSEVLGPPVSRRGDVGRRRQTWPSH